MICFARRFLRRHDDREDAGRSPEEREMGRFLDRHLRDSQELLLRELDLRPDCPDDQAFSRFLSGRCGRNERKRILDHVLACHACLSALDDLAANRSQDPAEGVCRIPVLFGSVGRWRRNWGWGVRLGAPVAALLVALFWVSSLPSVRMELDVTQRALRTQEAVGMRLHEGDRFRVAVSARKGGYFFLYAWAEDRGGRFLFPDPERPDDNKIRKGQRVFVPNLEGWQIEEGGGGEETFLLLFSPRAVSPRALAGLEARLAESAGDLAGAKRLLKRHFSVEQRLSCHVD